MSVLSAAEFRNNTAETLNRVAYGKERIILGRRGEPIAALISLEDLSLLQRLEDQMDLEAIAASKHEEGESVPWDTLKRELDL